jgi:hypothetical protein
MSGGNGDNEWAGLFASFHARHRDPEEKKLKFTIIFNTAIESLMANPEVPLEWRVLAFIWRRSWATARISPSMRSVESGSGRSYAQKPFRSINGGSATLRTLERRHGPMDPAGVKLAEDLRV